MKYKVRVRGIYDVISVTAFPPELSPSNRTLGLIPAATLNRPLRWQACVKLIYLYLIILLASVTKFTTGM